MGRSSIGSSYTAPSRIKPHVGKISEDDVESRSDSNDCCDVLKEQAVGSNDASNAADFGPEVTSRTFADASLIAGVANVLAREACMDAIHSARVFGWIEQPNVSLMHSQPGEPSVVGSLSQDLAGVSVPLDSGNWRVSEDEVGEQSAAGSGKEVQGAHARSPTATPRAKPGCE
jgi:hypothetical protein